MKDWGEAIKDNERMRVYTVSPAYPKLAAMKGYVPPVLTYAKEAASMVNPENDGKARVNFSAVEQFPAVSVRFMRHYDVAAFSSNFLPLAAGKVKRAFGTKPEAAASRLEEILRRDPTSKVVVFSRFV